MVRVAEAGGTPRSKSFATEGTVMRPHFVIIAAVAVILIGLGVKLIFFLAPTAEAKLLSVKSVSMNISEIHRNTNIKNLPAQKIHDMTFVFSDGD
jgi:hypothetical protein